jgi:hypothetical protein
MAGWTQYAGWMRYAYLDDCHELGSAYTLSFKFTDHSGERWSGRGVQFKAKQVIALGGAIKTLELAVPSLMAALQLDPEATQFVPALSSGDTVAQPNGFVSKLAEYSARSVNCSLNLSALSKNAHKPIHGLFNAAERQAVLEAANYQSGVIDAANVIVVDDIITRGSTLSRIAQAIRATNPEVNLYAIGLMKAERLAYWQGMGVELSNAHVPDAYDATWRHGEQWVRDMQARHAKT